LEEEGKEKVWLELVKVPIDYPKEGFAEIYECIGEKYKHHKETSHMLRSLPVKPLVYGME